MVERSNARKMKRTGRAAKQSLNGHSQTGAGRRVPADIRASIQRSSESIQALCRRYHLNPKTVRRWRDRDSSQSRKPGPRIAVATALSPMAEVIAVCFRRLVGLSLDDCHHLLDFLLVKVGRASLYRCLRRYRMARRPSTKGVSPRSGWFDVHLVPLATKNQDYFAIVGVEQQSGYVELELYPDVLAGALDFPQRLQRRAPTTVQGVCLERGAMPIRVEQALRSACIAVAMPLSRSSGQWPDQSFTLRQPLIDAMHKHIDALGLEAARSAVTVFLEGFNQRCRLKSRDGLSPAMHIERSGGAGIPAPRAHRIRSAEWDGGTREVILRNARSLLSAAGPDGMSLSAVARMAGVNRGTVYRHFRSRTSLIGAIAAWGSEQLTRAIFGVRGRPEDTATPRGRVASVQRRIANFAIRHPTVCQAWLLQVLSMPDPSKDRFWREYYARSVRFHETPAAATGVDAEVLSVIMLAGAFLWPVWARSKSRGQGNMQRHADRFVREYSRLALHGAVRGGKAGRPDVDPD
jgi:AcrR family transcriptional regulator